MSTFDTDISLLRQIVIRETSIAVEAVQATMNLSQSILGLSRILDERRKLIEEFGGLRAKGLSDEAITRRYFGLPDKDRLDERYLDTMVGIGHNIDTMIYMSIFLAEKFRERGNEIKAAHRNIDAKINYMIWDELLKDEAFPNHEDFPNFKLASNCNSEVRSK
jgi:hypothetical protein